MKINFDLPVPSPCVVLAEYFDSIFDGQEGNLEAKRVCCGVTGFTTSKAQAGASFNQL